MKKPPHIVFAWEFGENYGHLRRDLTVARRLRSLGARVTFVLRELRVGEILLAGEEFSYIAAPSVSRSAVRSGPPPTNYSAMLLKEGYSDHVALTAAVRAWKSLYELLEPTTIVIDHAPTALLAAHITEIPAIQLGTGFTIPPRRSPFPSMRTWENVDHGQLSKADETLVVQLNNLLRMFKCRECERAFEALSPINSTSIIATFPELDHYGARTDSLYVGPLGDMMTGPNVRWRSTSRPRIFAYLKPTLNGFASMIRAIDEIDAECICAAPGLLQTHAMHLQASQVQIVPQLISLPDILSSADLIVSDGGSGLIAHALLAGVPMVLAPHTVEQYLASKRVEEIGAGAVLEFDRRADVIKREMQRVASDGSFASAAQRFAASHKAFSLDAAVDDVAMRILGA